MEFRNRATDQSPSVTNFTDQASRVGLNVTGYSGPKTGSPNEYRWNSIEVGVANWRELEKKRIREEIIAEERRMLEAEVRRELMIEREMAMWFDTRVHPAPEPTSHTTEGMSLEERIGMSAELMRGEFGCSGTIPFQQERSTKLITEVKRASEVSNEEERIILMAKPEADLSGVKRKVETTLAVGAHELPSVGATKKKVKQEWSCPICQVSATSELGLNEHLQGKRHKAKEARLRKNGKNCSIGIGYPKETVKPNKPAEIAGDPSSDWGLEIVEESVQPEILGQSSLLTDSNSESPKKSDVPLLTKNVAVVPSKPNDKELKKKKFKFWCEMCQVGAFAENVMEAHRRGKKHIARLQQVYQNGGAVPSAQIDLATQGFNDAGEADKIDGENIVSEIVYDLVDGVEPVGQQTAQKMQVMATD